MAGRIVIGTSSWAAPGFVQEWYPPDLAARDRLAWYAPTAPVAVGLGHRAWSEDERLKATREALL